MCKLINRKGKNKEILSKMIQSPSHISGGNEMIYDNSHNFIDFFSIVVITFSIIK